MESVYIEIEHRWSFDTSHQEGCHRRLTNDGESTSLPLDQVAIHNDFGSKCKKATDRVMSLTKNQNITSYSTEFHQKYSHIRGLSFVYITKIEMLRHYFLSDECTQDLSRVVCNKIEMLKRTKDSHHDVKSCIYMSDGGHQ